jgi:hypothetical protein
MAKFTDDHFNQSTIESLTEDERRRREAIIKSLQLRIKNRTPNHFPVEFEEVIFAHWCEEIRQNQILHELNYAYISMQDAYKDSEVWEEDEDELERLEINISQWICNARVVFDENTTIFYSKLAEEDDYLKHFPPPNATVQNMLNLSQKRALLKPNVDKNWLDIIFTKIACRYAYELYTKSISEFIVQTGEFQGYSKGKVCTHLLYKVDTTIPIYHVYPINDEEVNTNKMPILDRFAQLTTFAKDDLLEQETVVDNYFQL